MVGGGEDKVPSPAAFADEFRILMAEGFPFNDGGFAFQGIEQRLEAFHLVDSLEAAISFRLQWVGDELLNQLKKFTVSLGSRDAARFSSMVLHSLLGLAQARTDLRSFVRDQLSGHPLEPLLRSCTDPPDADAEQLARSRAFYAVFGGDG